MADPFMDITGILEIMPHRFPFLLVDRILELKVGEYVIGLKNVTFNEPFFPGHFPVRPVMPGVLIIEAMAQCGALLVFQDESTGLKAGNLVFVASFDKVKFRKPVIPGDQLMMHLKHIRSGKKIIKMSGEAKVDGQVVASGELTAIILPRSESNQ
jgi:3-hydroxyacyl-[acyl-carrier-protein] dehydratase